MHGRLAPCALALVCSITMACHARRPVEKPDTPPPAGPEASQPAEPRVAPPAPAAPAGSPAPIAETVTAGHPHARVAGGVAGGFGGATRGSVAPFNTESYDRIYDNAWKLVANDPLSTFSVDVDTASYANLRRFLNAGNRPPADAVRIEELINYFGYDYPQPHGTHPFSVTTEIGPCPWEPRHRLLLVGLQGKRMDAEQIPPRNLVFLVDVSGSMDHPQKLPLVKASLTMLAQNLTARDRVSIVVYASASGLVLPSTPGSDRSRILRALAELRAGGSTNGAAGIQLAYQEALEHFIPAGVNRVILATDGDFNVGVTDRGSLTRLIEEKRRAGVALSVLGYGMGNLKDATLEQLADKGNGNYAYIDSMQEANKVLVAEAGGTLVTIAKDVKLQLEFNPRHVAAFRLIGYENRVLAHQDFKDDTKDAGEIGAGHSVTALYELIPPGVPLPRVPEVDPLKYQQPGARVSTSDEWLTVKLRYKRPEGETSVPFDVPVAPRGTTATGPNLGFASAVAAFGMVLRDSEHKATATYDLARALARKHRGEDPHGHRAEFIRLTEVAAAVTRSTQ